MASEHLSWLVVRNNNAFIKKVRNVKQPFSIEPHNLANRSSFRYSGLVRNKTVGVEAVTKAGKGSDRGVVLVTRKARRATKPVSSLQRTTFKAPGSRRTLNKLRRSLVKNNYRKDLTKAALVRASVILKSQKPIKRKSKGKKAE